MVTHENSNTVGDSSSKSVYRIKGDARGRSQKPWCWVGGNVTMPCTDKDMDRISNPVRSSTQEGAFFGRQISVMGI